MANLNKVLLMGRLTREPDIKEFANGGKVAQMGFAVHNRRKNQDTGAWEEVPVWMELKAYNREQGRKLADLAEKHLHKGMPVYVEGHLALEEWEGKDSKRHSRTLVYVDGIEFLGGGGKGAGAGEHAGVAQGDPGEPVAEHGHGGPGAGHTATGKKRGRPAKPAAGEGVEDAPF